MKAVSFWRAVILDKSNLLDEIFVAVGQIDRAKTLMLEHFQVDEFPHSLNVSSAGSNLRVQFQTDPRDNDFVERASVREVLGLQLPVGAIEDVLQGKIWATSHPERRSTKRRKDLLDIEGLLESHPARKVLVPEDILEQMRR